MATLGRWEVAATPREVFLFNPRAGSKLAKVVHRSFSVAFTAFWIRS